MKISILLICISQHYITETLNMMDGWIAEIPEYDRWWWMDGMDGLLKSLNMIDGGGWMDG